MCVYINIKSHYNETDIPPSLPPFFSSFAIVNMNMETTTLSVHKALHELPIHCFSNLIFYHSPSCLLYCSTVWLLCCSLTLKAYCYLKDSMLMLFSGEHVFLSKEMHMIDTCDGFISILNCKLIRKNIPDHPIKFSNLHSHSLSLQYFFSIEYVTAWHFIFNFFLSSAHHHVNTTFLFTIEFLAPRTVPSVHLLRKISINMYTMDYWVVPLLSE